MGCCHLALGMWRTSVEPSSRAALHITKGCIRSPLGKERSNCVVGLQNKAEGTWSDCRCLKGHILQKVHILPRASLALEILALRPKTFPFLISMERRDLSPSGSGLAWVPILPHLVLTQASMKENLVALPLGFPEMSLPHPHHIPVPSLPKSVDPFPSLTPWVAISIVEQPDSSSPCSGSPDLATCAPCWRTSRNWQEDPLNKENVL